MFDTFMEMSVEIQIGEETDTPPFHARRSLPNILRVPEKPTAVLTDILV